MWRCQGLVLSTNVQNQKLRKIRKCHIDIPVFLSPVPFHSVSIMIHWQGKLNLLDSSTEHTIASFLCFSGVMWRSTHQNRRWCFWFWYPCPPGQFQSFQPSTLGILSFFTVICHLFVMCDFTFDPIQSVIRTTLQIFCNLCYLLFWNYIWGIKFFFVAVSNIYRF